jgi:hypothetical protein
MQKAEQILQAMRKMGEIDSQETQVSSGELDNAKVLRPVRRGVCGKVPSIQKIPGNSPLSYPTT